MGRRPICENSKLVTTREKRFLKESNSEGKQNFREMGLLSNRVQRESLKPGDHIYPWRTAYIYAHHGIYVGDDKVIHFTRRGQEVGTGTVLDVLLISSGPARSHQ